MFADTHNRAAGIPRLVKPLVTATVTAVLFDCTSLAAYGAAPAEIGMCQDAVNFSYSRHFD